MPSGIDHSHLADMQAIGIFVQAIITIGVIWYAGFKFMRLIDEKLNTVKVDFHETLERLFKRQDRMGIKFNGLSKQVLRLETQHEMLTAGKNVCPSCTMFHTRFGTPTPHSGEEGAGD